MRVWQARAWRRWRSCCSALALSLGLQQGGGAGSSAWLPGFAHGWAVGWAWASSCAASHAVGALNLAAGLQQRSPGPQRSPAIWVGRWPSVWGSSSWGPRLMPLGQAFWACGRRVCSFWGGWWSSGSLDAWQPSPPGGPGPLGPLPRRCRRSGSRTGQLGPGSAGVSRAVDLVGPQSGRLQARGRFRGLQTAPIAVLARRAPSPGGLGALACTPDLDRPPPPCTQAPTRPARCRRSGRMPQVRIGPRGPVFFWQHGPALHGTGARRAAGGMLAVGAQNRGCPPAAGACWGLQGLGKDGGSGSGGSGGCKVGFPPPPPHPPRCRPVPGGGQACLGPGQGAPGLGLALLRPAWGHNTACQLSGQAPKPGMQGAGFSTSQNAVYLRVQPRTAGPPPAAGAMLPPGCCCAALLRPRSGPQQGGAACPCIQHASSTPQGRQTAPVAVGQRGSSSAAAAAGSVQRVGQLAGGRRGAAAIFPG